MKMDRISEILLAVLYPITLGMGRLENG